MARTHDVDADVEIFVDTEDVKEMLDRAFRAISDVSITAFLAGPTTQYLQERAGMRFQTEGDSSVGGPWDALKPATIEARKRQGYDSGPINHRSGELERYITGANGVVAANVLQWPGGDPGPGESGHLETKVITAQSGKAHPETQPRPVIGVDMSDLVAVTSSLALYIARGGVGVGGR
jgi:hypothetical protein